MHTASYYMQFCNNLKRWSLLSIGLLATFSLSAQEKTTRILFVLDASGSMAAKWNGIQKFDIARDLLYHAVDSLEDVDPEMEFGLRLFGFQSHRSLHDCEDSKLMVPFARGNARKVHAAMQNIMIQGQTPIAYSLFQAVNDFPNDPLARNVIVLITDGIETCEGDPCAISGVLKKRNIALRPFVIGLGLEAAEAMSFDCVGQFYDATNKQSFRNALKVVISQAVNSTTAQVNLLDANDDPMQTNVEMTFYDSYSGNIEYMLVHAIDYYDKPDTIFLSPVIDYDLTVHTTPPVTKKGIRLTPGKHNIIAVDVPQGYLTLKIEGFPRLSDTRCVIRKSGESEIVTVQDLNSRKKLLTGSYDLEILTLPRIEKKNVEIKPGEETTIAIPENGKVSVQISRPGIFSIYNLNEGEVTLIYEADYLDRSQSIELLPGEYMAVFRQHKFKSAELTQTKNFKIISKGSVSLTF